MYARSLSSPTLGEREGVRCLCFVFDSGLSNGEAGDRNADYLSAPLSAVPSPRANPCMAPHSTPSAHSAGLRHTAHTARTHEGGLGLVTRRLCRMAHKKYGLSLAFGKWIAETIRRELQILGMNAS